MPKRVAFIEAEIDRRLSQAVAADSPNLITAAEVRDWARHYLAEMDALLADDPTFCDEPHGDLMVEDAAIQQALFAALIFRSECVEFFCGTGDPFVVRFYTVSGTDPDLLYDEMAQTCVIPQPPLRIERRAAALWLGRGWKP
jgi:hypothetical protein